MKVGLRTATAVVALTSIGTIATVAGAMPRFEAWLRRVLVMMLPKAYVRAESVTDQGF